MRPYLRPKLSSSFVSCVSGSGDIWCDMWSVLRNLKYLGQPAAAELATSVFYSWLYNSHTQQHGIELVKLFGLEWNGDFEKLMNHSCNQELSLCKDDPAGSKFSQKYIRDSGKVESNFKHLRQITLLVNTILDEFLSVNTHGELLNLDIHGLLLRCQHSSNDCSLEHLSFARVWSCETKNVKISYFLLCFSMYCTSICIYIYIYLFINLFIYLFINIYIYYYHYY